MSSDQPGGGRGSGAMAFHIGPEEIVIRQRYELASIVNDILIAVWFTIGSILFFSPSTSTAGTWLFLLGSIQLLVRPVIRFTRRVHIQRRRGRTTAIDLADDY